MPLGALSPQPATLLWIGLQLAAVVASCFLLWRIYRGPDGLKWLAPLLGLTFAPVVWMVLWGQNTGFVLLGLAGFLYFRQVDRPALAGACASLTALKPHLLAPFGLLLVLDAVTRRGRIALLSGGAAIALGLGLALLANPDVLSEYRQAVRDPGQEAEALDAWVLPVASYWLRIELGLGFWVQFVPCLLVCLGLAVHRLTRGSDWNWRDQLPTVIWFSVLATPYGGWIFDLTVLLVPLIALAARLVPRALIILFLGHLTITSITLAFTFTLPGFWWVPFSVLGLWLAGLLYPRVRP
jgi:hypothetical protein